MEYRLGNSKRINDKGLTTEIKCPNCEKQVQFGVFSNFEARLAVKATLFDLDNVYFLVCPECASIYTVDRAFTRGHRKKDLLDIHSRDLEQLKEFKVND